MKERDLESLFISRILREEAENIEAAKMRQVAKFTASFRFASRYNVRGGDMEMTHPKVLRFIDMKTREVKGIKKRKRAHPVHNRIIFGHANNVVRRVSFEFTSEMKEMLMKEFPVDI